MTAIFPYMIGSAPPLDQPFSIIDILPRRCICTTRVESRDSHMESTKTIAFPIQSVDPTSLFPCAGEDQDICRVGIAHQPFSLLITKPVQ